MVSIQEGEGNSGINPNHVEHVLENLDIDVAVEDAPGSPTKPVPKKRKKIGSKTPRTVNVASDEEMRELRDEAPDRVGKFSVVEVAKLMSGIPSKQDWTGMEQSGLNVVLSIGAM